jgi:anti-sigma B factor antagonist
VPALPNFWIEQESGTTLKVAGELDSATSPELIAAFERIAAEGPTGQIVLDLTRVSFVDSAGMRAIIVIERMAAERGIALRIHRAAGPVTDLLQMTGLGDRIALAPQAGGPPPSEPFVERVELELPREPAAPGQARRELREAIAGRVSEDDGGTLTLLTSELVTNAVIHPRPDASGPIRLRITVYPDRVRVEVSDGGAGFDAATLPPGPRETGGHGLVVVDGLSSRWGTRSTTIEGGEGFCVWFELDAESERAETAPAPAAEPHLAVEPAPAAGQPTPAAGQAVPAAGQPTPAAAAEA